MFKSLYPHPPPPSNRKYCCLCRDVQKYAIDRQVEDSNKIRRMRLACWMPKATDTHSEYVILSSHGKNGCTDTPQCYVHRYISCLVKLYSHLCLGLLNGLRPSHSPTKKKVHIPLLPHTRIMPRPFKPPPFHYPTIVTRISNESSHYVIVSKLPLRHPP